MIGGVFDRTKNCLREDKAEKTRHGKLLALSIFSCAVITHTVYISRQNKEHEGHIQPE